MLIQLLIYIKVRGDNNGWFNSGSVYGTCLLHDLEKVKSSRRRVESFEEGSRRILNFDFKQLVNHIWSN